MKVLGFTIGSKKREVLKTDEVRRKTQDEVSNTKGELEARFAHFSDLLNGTLLELNKPLLLPKPIRTTQVSHSKRVNKRQK